MFLVTFIKLNSNVNGNKIKLKNIGSFMTISNEIINKKWVLKKRPIGMAKKTDFELQEETIEEISENEIILKNKYISFDPTQRGWLNDAPGYLPPVQIDEVVRAMGVGEVVESKNDQYEVGDLVIGFGSSGFSSLRINLLTTLSSME